MPDREKVIQWLEACSVGCEEGCPYEYDGLVSKVECKADLMRDALELLKGQEPVAPVLVPTVYGAGIAYNCGACGTELVVLNGTNVQGVPSVVRFCRMCGKRVKWDAVD